jgi:UDP-glucuronate 4-epimerase
MALYKFADAILAGRPIEVFNHGHHKRDFTFVDDIVSGVVGAMDQIAKPNAAWDSARPDPASSSAPYRIYNIGNTESVPLMRYIELLEQCLGRVAKKTFLPLQTGDVPDTWADVSDLTEAVGYEPTTSVEVGVKRFADWFLDYRTRRACA